MIRFLPLYLRSVGTPDAIVPRWTGLLSTAVFVFGLPLVPFWGVWADKYSRKVVIARSAYVEALVFLALALSQNRYQVAASLLLVGFQLGNSGVMLSTLRTIAPARHVGFVVAFLGVTPPIGVALGPLVGGLLVDRGGFTLHQIFLLDGALSLVSGLMLTLFLREVRPPDPPTGPVLALVGRALRLVFTTRVTVLLFTIMSLTFLATQTAAPFFPLLVRRLHPDPAGLATAIGLVFGVSTLVGALLSPIAGVLGDRYGFQRVLVAAAAAGAVSLVGMPLAPSLLVLALYALVFGAASATATAMVIAQLAVDLPDDRRSATLNLVYVPLYLGGILGGVLGALLVQGGLGLVMTASRKSAGHGHARGPPIAGITRRSTSLAVATFFRRFWITASTVTVS